MNIPVALAVFSCHDFLSPEQTDTGGAAMKKMEKQIAEAISLREKFLQPLIVTDPNGSYTGRPQDPSERPVQDADDL